LGKRKTIVVGGVDEDIWVEFKSWVVRRKLTMREALEEAVTLWVKYQKSGRV
jgi:hypothetical protein